MDIASLRADPKMSLEGVWMDYEGGIKFLIAKLGNPNYEAELQALLEADGIKNQADLSKAASEAYTAIAAAKTLVLDWEGITEDGEEVPFSKEKCLEYLTDPTLRDLLRDIIVMSNERAKFQIEREEEAGKD